MLKAEECRKIWLGNYENRKEEIDKEINENIEKYRKGNCKIKVTDKEGNPISCTKLRVKQTGHDFKYGANMFMLDEFDDDSINERYRDTFYRYFNLGTVPFYWDGLEAEEGKPRYAKDSPKVYRRPAPDLCVEYCEEKGILPKLHCLVYPKFSPAWLLKKEWKDIENQYMRRFSEISERYCGRMYEFEVINEWLGNGYLLKRPDSIEWAFQNARKYFENETLLINEGSFLEKTASEGETNAYFKLIKKHLDNNVCIDKIGIQHHIFTGVDCETQEEYEKEVMSGLPIDSSPTGVLSVDYYTIKKGLEYYAKFNKPFEITEMTIPTFGESEEFEDLQADMLKLIYSTFFSSEIIDAAVYWNLADGYAYIAPGWNESNCRGGLFHKDMTPKKSALMLKHLFTELWHTDEDIVTDKDGFACFRGFYGDYEVNVQNDKFNISIHKNSDNLHTISI